MNAEERILIVGPSWIGDMVMAQGLFAELKSSYPDANLDVLAPAWSAGIVDKMPEVDQLLESPFKHGRLNLAERYRFGRMISVRGYTRAFVLPNSWKAALVPALARIPIRTAYVGEQRWGLINDIRTLDRSELPMMIQRFVALGRAPDATPPPLASIKLPRLVMDDAAASKTAGRFGLGERETELLVLCPGSEFGPAKQWPTEQYAGVARHYLERDWNVAILGSEGDAGAGDRISEIVPGIVTNLAGKTTLNEAAEILSVANLVVTNDSGLMHVASAAEAPVVAVYGSTDPGFTPPLGANSTVVRLGLKCSPCFKRECPLGHLDCLKKIGIEQVIGAGDRVQRGPG